jgi:opacity protein-like surface antigen
MLVTLPSASTASKFLPANRVQPYLLFGVSYNGLEIKKGAANIFTGEIADAKLYGTGLNFGAGIDNYFGSNVSLALGIMYRYIDFTEAKGVHQSGSIDDGLNGSGFSLLLTTAYHF